MNKQLFSRIHPLVAAVVVVGALLAVLFTAYGLTRWTSAGEVMGRVSVAEADIGGRTPDQALSIISAIEVSRLTRIAHFIVDDKSVELQPGYTGLAIDEAAVVDEAMMVGRQGNFANQFLHWLTHIFTTAKVELKGSLSEMAMQEIFDEWDTQVIAKPILAGGIELNDGELVPVYPETGVGVEREPAMDIVLETLLATEATEVEIPTVTVVPELTDADVDAAFLEAQKMLAGPITLTYEDQETVLSQEQLEAAFASETITNSPAAIVNSFDPTVVDGFINPIRAQFEAEPVNAEFVIHDDNTVTVQPGSNGTRIDEVETAARLYQASQTENRTAELPIVEGAEPEFTTEYLESLNVKHLVSQFTTYHDCCENRVTNIHLIAEAVDGVLVLPGETFSLNDHVGERTAEKGYLPAGSIVAGEIVDTLGGGTSQFTTTMYNAVFWGGYEDVEHQPHSYYFSRYPEGVEATLFWRSIDLKFRNNREHAILVDTRYTDTSITVRFFGFNDGRTLVGEQSGGESQIRVASEGGPNALHVKGETSDRYSIVEPGDPEIRPNPELDVDEQVHVQSPREGWSVTVTRRILKGGTELVEEQEWVVRYRPQVEIIEVHPCMVPGPGAPACPTTTTVAPATTTTASSSTTPP
ncbi:MAG TPA: VanW family protein [Acidimicrobiia bacterium]|jgi:vancomycin resistance protein YoaR|nr:VanW family protein [Acidimicrobiia bacterium]